MQRFSDKTVNLKLGTRQVKRKILVCFYLSCSLNFERPLVFMIILHIRSLTEPTVLDASQTLSPKDPFPKELVNLDNPI